VATTKKDKIIKKNNQLIEMIQGDEKLSSEERMSYVSLANLFLEKFDEYINYTSLEMNKHIPLGVDTWRDFLNYPIVRKYIQSFKDEQISSIADKGLMEGDKNAVGIKKVVQERGPVINNSNIVLIRLPEKEEFDV
jgi:hypothetical protein